MPADLLLYRYDLTVVASLMIVERYISVPAPIVVDVTRDTWDVVMIVGSLASVVTGIVALAFAWVSLRQARRARRDAGDAERRSIERAAAERRTVFELEVLRDLANIVGTDPKALREFAAHPETFTPFKLAPLLAMIPANELSFWRSWPTSVRETRWQQFPEITQAELDEAKQVAASVGPMMAMPSKFMELLSERLQRDIVAAIERRMKAPQREEPPAQIRRRRSPAGKIGS